MDLIAVELTWTRVIGKGTSEEQPIAAQKVAARRQVRSDLPAEMHLRRLEESASIRHPFSAATTVFSRRKHRHPMIATAADYLSRICQPVPKNRVERNRRLPAFEPGGAGPFPIACVLDQATAHRVQMQVLDHLTGASCRK